MPGPGPRGGPRGGGPGGPRPHGKPKNTLATVKRLWSYVSKYKLRLILVLFCMLLSTVTSLIGGYMLAPIINRITLAVAPNANITFTAVGKIADKVITAVNTEKGFFEIQAKAVILAMGCRERSKGAINVPGTRPAGIYSAVL